MIKKLRLLFSFFLLILIMMIPSVPAHAASFTVTNINDSGPGSLRRAISDANSSPGHDSITFNILGSSPYTIRPETPLPVISDSVEIDGTTQPGYSGIPVIEIDGSNIADPADAIHITSGNSIIRGLIINNFNDGIQIDDNGGNVIELNFIGTDASGSGIPTSSNGAGIRVNEGANANTIGGIGKGNVISGFNRGIMLAHGTDGNTINANLIGTDMTGTLPLSNYYGIFINGSNNNVIQNGNVISGNYWTGIYLMGVTVDGVYFGNNNVIRGNFIGTDISGTLPLGNEKGIFIEVGQNNVIGGNAIQDRNIISGNTEEGIYLKGRDTSPVKWTTGNTILGNFIGLDVSGTLDLGNETGIFIDILCDGNIVGGTAPQECNVISGNDLYGIRIDGSASTVHHEWRPINNQVTGNYIGTDSSGTVSLGNGIGVFLESVEDQKIGDVLIGAGNVISGNTLHGIDLGFYTANVTVLGNYIGTSANGDVSVPNMGCGVFDNGSNNLIGGALVEARNIISGNGQHGIAQLRYNSLVIGNYIGTDVNGANEVPNSGNGIYITGSNNVIGGNEPGMGNVISGNSLNGIEINGEDSISTENNEIIGNYIGIDSSGIVALSNNQNGIKLDEADNTTIGGTEAGEGNIISGNLGNGIWINPLNTTNLIQGNIIGADITGTGNVGNSGHGVYIERCNGSSPQTTTTIGGTDPGAGNVLAFNQGSGIYAQERSFPIQNHSITAILANSIFSNGGLGIDLEPAGVTPNDTDDIDEGPNYLQNFPILHSAYNDNGDLKIEGSLNSLADTTFRIEFFSSITPDPSGYGEGEYYIGSIDITTDISGNSDFTATFSGMVPLGNYITATATQSDCTSEFSEYVFYDDVTITHTITASAGSGGTITPSGAVAVDHDASQIFTITPNAGYLIADVLVDESSVGAVTTYTFTNVIADHTISVSFIPDAGNPPEINSITADPSQLWPPNHKPVNVTISVDATDPDGLEDIVRTTYSVIDEYGIYDVAETDLPENGIISLIADRNGKDKNGRVYTITITVYDANGLSDSSSIDVVVSHDQGQKEK